MRAQLRLAMTYLKSPSDILRNVRWRRDCSVSQEPVVFVVGAPRSGTTLLQRMLSLHDQLFSFQGETGLFSFQNIFARKHFDLSWKDTQILFRQCSDIVDFLQNGIRTLRKQRELPGNTRLVEKTPQHVLHLKFLIQHFPNARFLHIVRDGRDCYCSSLNHPHIRQKTSARTFARYWVRCVRTGLAFDGHPNVTRLSYEELAESPRTVLSRTMGTLGLALQEGQLDPHKIGLDARSARTEFARLAEPIQTTSIGRWRRELTPPEMQTFHTHAGPVLAQLSYPTPSLPQTAEPLDAAQDSIRAA